MSIDHIARGLGSLSYARSNDAKLRLRKLRDLALARRYDNCRTNGVMASPPTIAADSAATPATAATAYKAASTTLLSTNPFRFYGCDASRINIQSTDFVRFPALTLSGSGTGGNITGAQSGSTWRAEAFVDSDLVGILVGGSSLPFRFLVDDQYVDTTGTATALSSGSRSFLLTFASRAKRRITVEGEQSQAFRGMSCIGTGAVYPVPNENFRLLVLGDSITNGTGGTRIGDGFARILGDMLGVRDTIVSGVGSTGYLANSSGTRYTLRERVPSDVPTSGVDAVVVAMGRNDTAGTSAITAEVTLAIAAIRSTVGLHVPIFVGGQFPGSSGPSAGDIAIDAAIASGVSALNDPLVEFVSISSDAAGAWISGTGRTGSTTGTGNADIYMGGTDGTDTTHPNTAGHLYYGTRWADAIINSSLVRNA